MLDCRRFLQTLRRRGVAFWAGVPDSLLEPFCAAVAAESEPGRHVITANEGAAVALAAGHHLATGGVGLVYLQNSGLGNTVNPLTSLADPEVYSIPMLLLIGWRGAPGVKDEPQHVKQGRVMLPMLDALEVAHRVLPLEDAAAEGVVAELIDEARRRSAPVALVARKSTFGPYPPPRPAGAELPLCREDVVRLVVEALGAGDVLVSTTGKTSREVFELRAARGDGHGRDFLTVGCMGHASQIALGIALAQPRRRVWCLDGDGALIMHMGSLAVIGTQPCGNLRHVVVNNGAHESVGGQPTAGFAIDVPAIALACGYAAARRAESGAEARAGLSWLAQAGGPALLEVRVRQGSRPDLGRPTTTPAENKRDFMDFLRHGEPSRVKAG